MKRSLFYRVLAFLYVFIVGGQAFMNSAQAAEITLTFANEGVLPTELSSDSKNPSTGSFNIGGYNVKLANCSQTSKRLVLASSSRVNEGVGSITFHLTQKLTSIKFNAKRVTSKGTMTVKVGDTTISDATTPIVGENAISIGSDIETKGKDCTISFTKKTVLTTVTFVTDGTSTDPDPEDPSTKNWAKFVKYNDKTTDLTNVTELPAGQVISLESLAEGFMPNSAIDNNYVVVYTLDGKEPTFVAEQGGDNDKYWKDPKESKNNYGYVYRRGIALHGNTGDKITVKVSIFKVTKDDTGKYQVGETAENSFSQAFTLTASTRPDDSNIKFSPSTVNDHEGKDYASTNTSSTAHPTVLDITESCTASSSTKGNIIVAKYSTNSKYDIQQILNAANVSLDNTTAGVFSTKLKMRKTSAIQIDDNGLISNDVAKAFYWYIPARKNLILEAIPSYTDLSMTGTSSETVTLKAYHLNANNERVYVSLDSLTIHIKSNDEEIATTDGTLTYAADKLSATFVINAKDNGTTRINVTSDQTSIVSENANEEKDEAETAYSYNAAATDVTVKVIDGKTMAPPTINPETSAYHTPFKSSVQADAAYSAYYWVVKTQNTADTQSTPTPEEVKSNGKFIEKGQKIETYIEAGIGNVYTVYAVSYDEPTQTLGTRVVQSTYTYMTVEKPVLTPGIEGNDNFFSFSDDELTIIASVATAGAQVYYTINSSDDNVTKDNGILYDGSQKIHISSSSHIHAVAYKDGIYSDVVLYRYNMQKTDLDAPTFHIDNSSQSFTTRHNIGNSKINIKATYTDEDGNTQDIVDTDDKVKDGFTIYYSTDGQMPTDQSPKYNGAFTVSGTVKVIYAYVKADDGSISDRSSLTLTNSNLNVWETTEGNCPNGVLQNTHQELSSEDGNTLYVKADFGGFASETDKRDNKQVWDHYTSKETSCGYNIDGVGFYSIAPNIDAKDEMGVLYNHTKANTGAEGYQTHKSTFVLPAMGAYTKFEPQLDGTLTIYCFQEGALYYRDAIGTKECFNSQFLRKRPVYFVDEAGVSIAPTAVEASGTLSSKWASLETNNFADKGGMQNGIKQNLFTKKQTEDIYNMFNKVITDNNATHETPLTKLIVYMNDGTDNHKAVAGYGLPNNNDVEDDNVKESTGVCIPSASFMKYTFYVEAGKTYFFFGWMTKLGIRGFGFEPSATQPSGELDIKANKTESNTFTNGAKYATAKLNRTFEADKWTTLVLPFSVSASEVKRVFGDGTQILHYRTIQGRTMYFFKHYHQMIVAGTPVIIKPSNTVTNPTFNHIKIEAATVEDEPCNDYGYNGETEDTQYKMVASYNPQTLTKGNYFLAKNGTVKLWTGANTTLSGTNAYMTGSSTTATLNMAKAAFDNLNPESMDGNVTGIDFIESDDTSVDGNIYNVNGQLVRKDAKNTNGLSKGIYIVNGKKVIIK